MVDPNIPEEWLTTRLVSGNTNAFAQSERDEKIREIANGFVNLRSEWGQVLGKLVRATRFGSLTALEIIRRAIAGARELLW